VKAANNRDRYYQPRAVVPVPPDVAGAAAFPDQPELTEERVRRILDDDATGPIAIDAETIRAARRIARNLERR
jgi:hypothetical protein